MESDNQTVEDHKETENKDLFDEFEDSFLSILQPISSQISSHKYEGNEINANSANMQRFLQSTRKLDNFFMLNRALFSYKTPESIMVDEINNLKIEIDRKTDVLQRLYDQLASWSVKAENLDRENTANKD